MARVKLDLSVPDIENFQRVLDEARTHGLTVSRSFADLGMISGTIDAKAIDGLVHIRGIASVAPDRKTPPPMTEGHSATIVPLRRR